MSAPKHTPGPWHVFTRYEYSGEEPAGAKPEKPRYFIGCGPEDPMRRGHVDVEWSLDNARLIAAAPEMLEALKVAAGSLHPDVPDSWRASIEATIAKAEGRSK